MHVTPSDGLHILFKWDPAGVRLRTAQGDADGIDVRGEGGYIIVPPSKLARWAYVQVR